MMDSASSPNNVLALQWLLGSIFVAVYAWDRFKSPPTIRWSTTFGRYWSAFLGYMAAMLALYAFLGGGITSISPASLEWIIGPVPKDVASLPGPLLAALLLSSLLPQVPVLEKVDKSIKQWFWRVGNIPTEVRSMSRLLEDARYVLPAAVRGSFSPDFAAEGADMAWLDEPAESPQARWSRCIALFSQVCRWRDEPGYAPYVELNRAALDEIQSRLSELAQFLNARTLSELKSLEGSELVAHMRTTLEADMGRLWRLLCDFVAGGVLNASWNDAQRRNALLRLGFEDLPRQRSPLNSNDLVLVAGLVFIVMLFVPLAVRRFFSATPLPPNVRLLVMVPIVYTMAIVMAIYPKSGWAFGARSSDGTRPVAAYALSGAIAALAALFVSILFRFAFDAHGNVFQALATPDAFAKAWVKSLERWPWMLMTFAATVSIAWAADDYSNSKEVPKWLRWAECAVLAATFAATQYAVVELLMSYLPAADSAGFKGREGPLILQAAVIGGCIGALVPAMYRSKGVHVEAQSTAVATSASGASPA